MIFVKLVIDNFGVFRDRNEFDLRPGDVDRPIVLFGGKNGAGKTTILEAIRLCLYGRTALGNRVRYRDYEEYIEQRIHRSSNIDKQQFARIQLIFEHTHVGTRNIYDAVRYWNLEGTELREEISVYKDGQVLQDIPKDYWDDFLRDLIPPGVADLFFFDGEQIQALANDETEAQALSDAIRGLLNLDLVDRLQSDLNIYLKRQEKKDRTSLENATARAIKQLDSLDQSITLKRQERAQHMTQLDRANKKVEDSRQAFLKEGAGFITHRDALLARQHEIETIIVETEASIRNMAGELLPFSIIPLWNKRLHDRLRLEENVKQDRATFDALHAKADEILSIIGTQDFKQARATNFTDEEWKDLVNEISNHLRPQEIDNEIDIRHRVSDQTRNILFEWIDEAQNQLPIQLNELSSKLEVLEQELSEISVAINRVPDELVANPLLEEFQRSSKQVGMLEEQISEIDLRIHRLKLEFDEVDRERQKLQKQLAEADGIDEKVQRAAKAQVVLEDYLEQITQEKVQQLEDTFVEYFNRLARKKSLVVSAKIDPNTFTVMLYGDNRIHIPKSDLSAGEKQLYAMSLLWALRSVSGRILPIIMDTPMGRLDTDHRNALLENFFPFAANQVIILSTDSEIDVSAYGLIENTVSHAYRLIYDEEAGLTRPINGYFGEVEIETMQ